MLLCVYMPCDMFIYGETVLPLSVGALVMNGLIQIEISKQLNCYETLTCPVATL